LDPKKLMLIALAVLLFSAQAFGYGVSWNAYTRSSGAAECAQAGRDCLSAYNLGGNPQSCSSATYGGTAACSATPLGSGVSWSSSTRSSGSAECAEAGRNCWEAFNSSGSSQSCSSTTYGGSAGCTELVGGGVSWSSSTRSSGSAECAEAGRACLGAFNSSGSAQSCSSTTYGGSALCSPTVGAGTTWSSSTRSSGDAKCALSGRECLGAFNSSGSAQSCSSTTYGGSALCSASVGFGKSWSTSTRSSGDAECGESGGCCKSAFNSSGSSQSCSSSTYGGSALCSSVIGGGEVWSSSVRSSGSAECGVSGRCCKDAFNSSGSSQSCSSSTYGGSALCSTLVGGGEVWSSSVRSSGSAECGVSGRCCVTAFNSSGSSQSCSSSTYGGSALCSGVIGGGEVWSSSVRSSGSAECGESGRCCVTAFNSSGSSQSCSSSTYGGSALCSLSVGSGTTWSSSTRSSGSAECAKKGACCATAFNSSGSAQSCSSSTYGGSARCGSVYGSGRTWSSSTRSSGSASCVFTGKPCRIAFSSSGSSQSCSSSTYGGSALCASSACPFSSCPASSACPDPAGVPCSLTSGCPVCGNGNIDAGEQCDGSNLNGESCQSQGYGAGTLGCTSSCVFNTSACTLCGNGFINLGEQCDGSNLNGETCASRGLGGGELGCDDSCNYNTTGCCTNDCTPSGLTECIPAFPFSTSYRECGNFDADSCLEWNTTACALLPFCFGGSCIACSTGVWVDGACGIGSCAANQRQQTRTTSPSGCDTESQCVNDASCCDCTLGACCSDGCNFNPVGTVCGTETQTVCSGAACGDDVVQESRDLICSGSDADCPATGSGPWGQTVLNDCLISQKCSSLPAPQCVDGGIACIVECNNDAGCDDGDTCTTDICSNPGALSASCGNNPVANDCGTRVCGNSPNGCFNCGSCPAGQLCDLFGNCSVVSCNDDTECDDGNPCTNEQCTNPGTISSACNILNKPDGTACTSDGDSCTQDVCSAGSCIHPLVPNDCVFRVCGLSPSGCFDCGTCPVGEVCTGAGTCAVATGSFLSVELDVQSKLLQEGGLFSTFTANVSNSKSFDKDGVLEVRLLNALDRSVIDSYTSPVTTIPASGNVAFTLQPQFSIDSLPHGNYIIAADIRDTELPPNMHDSESVRFTVIPFRESFDVPELPFFIVPLLLLSILFIARART